MYLQAWSSFFCAWISTFSPAALLPLIRESLNLTTFDIGNAGIAAVCGAIAGELLFSNTSMCNLLFKLVVIALPAAVHCCRYATAWPTNCKELAYRLQGTSTVCCNCKNS